jgi:hypothetical protein
MLPAFAAGQTAFDPKNPDREKGFPNSTGLFARLASADYAVTGTVMGVEFAGYRQQLAEMERNFRKDGAASFNLTIDLRSMALYTVRVDSTLCRKSDFSDRTARMPDPVEVFVFNPPSRPTDQLFRDEILHVGGRYLFLLGLDPDAGEKIGKFEVDPTAAYYRVLHHSDGAVEIPRIDQKAAEFKPSGYVSGKDLATPVLKNTRALCEALQPASRTQRLDKMKRLRASRDRAMRENAEAAIDFLP